MAVGACTTTTKTPAADPVVKLPAGALSGYVPQPADVPAGFVPLLAQTGPADLQRLASFSSNLKTATAALTKHGFQEGYVAEYADPPTGRSITVVVSRFTDSSGATADLTVDLSAKLPSTAHNLVVPLIGDQAGGVSQPLPGGPKGSELVTVRFRVGPLTWLVAVAARGPVDITAVTGIASNLAARAETLATASPSPSPS